MKLKKYDTKQTEQVEISDFFYNTNFLLLSEGYIKFDETLIIV